MPKPETAIDRKMRIMSEEAQRQKDPQLGAITSPALRVVSVRRTLTVHAPDFRAAVDILHASDHHDLAERVDNAVKAIVDGLFGDNVGA